MKGPIRFSILLILLAIGFMLLRECAGQSYLETENRNFERNRQKTKLNCDLVPLHCAIKVGDKEALRILLKSRNNLLSTDNWGRTALHWSASNGYEESVQLLLAAGADYSARDEQGEPIIVAAARSGNVKIVLLLLGAGASPNPKQPGSQSPLHAAISTNNLEMVELLLLHGSAIDAKSIYLAETQIYPSYHSNEKIVNILRSTALERSQR